MDYDLETQALLDALREAQQRQATPMQGVQTKQFGDVMHVAGPTTAGLLGDALSRGFGQVQEAQTRQRQRDLSTRQQDEFQQMLGELTTPGKKLVEGYSYGQGPLTDLSEQPREEVPLSPLEESQRRLNVYGKMSRLPMARGLASAGIKSEVDFPERQALLEQQQAQQRELQAQRDHEKWRFAQQFKLTADQQKGIADARTAATANMPQIIAVQTEDADGRPVTKLIDKRTVVSGDEYIKPPPSSKGANAQIEKSKQATSDLLDKISMAEQGLPFASGFGAVVPAGIRQLYTDENTKISDASIASLSAEKAHELYGAAFTAAEQARAAQFLPVTTGPFPDTADTLKAKFKALRIIAEKKDARLNGRPDPHPKMYNDVLDPVAAPTAPAAPTGGSNDDAAARAWLAANPNDPRAAAVRKKLEGR